MSDLGSEDVWGLRPLKGGELSWLKTKRFYVSGLLNKFLSMECDAAALDCGNKAAAETTQQKLNRIIQKAGLNRWLGAVSNGETVYIYRATEEPLPEFTEEMEKALGKR